MANQINIWIFYDRRTNPGFVHRFTQLGEPNAIEIHILRDQSVDGGKGGDTIETKVMAAPPNSSVASHLPSNWRNEDWGSPERGYLGPHGLLYVQELEYSDPHSELAAAENKRIAASQPPTEVVESVEPSKGDGEGNSAPAPAPTPPVTKPKKEKGDKHGK